MRDLTQTETVKLEELIDATSVSAVLDAIALICDEKSRHIEVSYNDPRLAKTWASVAGWLSLASRKIGRALP